MTSKISIKIQNRFGVNSIKGEDISKEETLELIGLARTLIEQDAPTSLLSPAQYLQGDSLIADASASLITATTVGTVKAVRPTPLTPKQIYTPPATDDTPIKLGSNPNPDVKRIVPRQPVAVVEPTPAPVIEPNEKVYSTPGSSSATTTLADKLVSTFQTEQGIEPSAAPGTEFLTVDEQLAVLNENYHATGIKHKVYGGEITPMYRVRCDCPTCGTRGNHYIPEIKKDINCYDCRTPLLVEPAAGKFPERDEWGNFFTATKVNPRWQKA